MGTRKRHGTAQNLGNEKVVSSISALGYHQSNPPPSLCYVINEQLLIFIMILFSVHIFSGTKANLNETLFLQRSSESRSLLNLNYEKEDFNAADFFVSLVDEHFKGNDRFIVKIWQKLHPGKSQWR